MITKNAYLKQVLRIFNLNNNFQIIKNQRLEFGFLFGNENQYKVFIRDDEGKGIIHVQIHKRMYKVNESFKPVVVNPQVSKEFTIEFIEDCNSVFITMVKSMFDELHNIQMSFLLH